jgi:hypothetical protein
MCDYCSCRGHPLIERLGDDHARLLGWAARIETALQADDEMSAGAAMERLLAVLDPHLELEDRTLVPALCSDDAFTATVTVIGTDHQRARVGRPVTGPADPGWPTEVRAFVADLRAHIHLEEYDVFPAAAQLLSPAVWSIAECSVAESA